MSLEKIFSLEKTYCETPKHSPKSNHLQENDLIVKKIGGKILPESFVFLSFFIPYTMWELISRHIILNGLYSTVQIFSSKKGSNWHFVVLCEPHVQNIRSWKEKKKISSWNEAEFLRVIPMCSLISWISWITNIFIDISRNRR